MSTRALGRIAAVLGVLLMSALTLGFQRLGYFSTDAVKPLVFFNAPLGAARGQRVVFQPMQPRAPLRRFWAAVTITEPALDDPVFPSPHVRVAVEMRSPSASNWSYRPPIAFVPLGRLGALRPTEYLADIRWVSERGRDGSWRELICATYGDFEGKTIVYYYDPERPVPIVGWLRREQHRDEPPPQVEFAADGGDLPLD